MHRGEKMSVKDKTKVFNRRLKGELERYRAEHKGKCKHIHKDLGMTKADIHNYTTDRLPKHTDRVIRLSEYLGVPMSYLLGEETTTTTDRVETLSELGLKWKHIEKLKELKTRGDEQTLRRINNVLEVLLEP